MICFTVAAGRPESYASIMYKGPEHTEAVERAIKHIKYAVDLEEAQVRRRDTGYSDGADAGAEG